LDFSAARHPFGGYGDARRKRNKKVAFLIRTL
jgi:hypothetical protein